eukprot:11179517-Lingulodinium_polyedra.AAC.1
MASSDGRKIARCWMPPPTKPNVGWGNAAGRPEQPRMDGARVIRAAELDNRRSLNLAGAPERRPLARLALGGRL